MRNILKMILPAFLLLAFLGGSALAQTKIATVDLNKLFDNYWKTKQAQVAIQERAAELKKDDESMKDALKKGEDDYKTLLEQANDQAVSADERDRRKQSAADKLKQLQSNKAAIDTYERQAQTTLGEQRQRMIKSSLEEIKTAVGNKAKAAGYSVVLDTSTRTLNLGAGSIELPSEVVYSGGDNDLTAVILAQLNAGAPVDTTKPVTTAPPATDAPGSP
jgi:outer membrane protein